MAVAGRASRVIITSSVDVPQALVTVQVRVVAPAGMFFITVFPSLAITKESPATPEVTIPAPQPAARPSTIYLAYTSPIL